LATGEPPVLCQTAANFECSDGGPANTPPTVALAFDANAAPKGLHVYAVTNTGAAAELTDGTVLPGSGSSTFTLAAKDEAPWGMSLDWTVTAVGAAAPLAQGGGSEFTLPLAPGSYQIALGATDEFGRRRQREVTIHRLSWPDWPALPPLSEPATPQGESPW
jgi:hypothetical protein